MKYEPPSLEQVRTGALLTIASILTLCAIYFVRSILFPVALSLLIALALRPLVRYLKERNIPQVVSAVAILLVLMAMTGFGLYAVAAPATAWMRNAPRQMQEVQVKLEPLRRATQEIGKAFEQVQGITKPVEADTPKVAVSESTLPNMVLNTTGEMLVAVGLVFSSLFVLLAYGDGFFKAISNLGPTPQHRVNILRLIESIEKMISRYLMTYGLINVGLGIVIGLGMWAIGMPNPLLWGVMAGALNFIPYFGLVVGSAILFFAALVTFDDSLLHAALAPLIYYVANLIESNWVTPTLLGRSLQMNIVILFLGVLFWGWLWGIGGILIAVPLMAAFQIVCEHFRILEPLARFLGSPEPKEPEPVAATGI